MCVCVCVHAYECVRPCVCLRFSGNTVLNWTPASYTERKRGRDKSVKEMKNKCSSN